jgi:hypothetical protein
VLAWQVPAGTLLVDAQFMASSEMPSEHLAAPPTFQTNDIVALNGSADRHCGCSLDFRFRRHFTEADERLMHGRDWGRELIGADLVSPNISSDDIGRTFSVERCRLLLVGQFGSPCTDLQNTMPGKMETTN